MTGLTLLENISMPVGGEAEIFLERKTRRSIGWADQKPQLYEMAEDAGVCLRFLKEGAQGVAVSKGASSELVSRLAAQAVETAKLMPKDPHRFFFQGGACYPSPISFDSSAFETSSDKILEKLSSIEKRILKADARLKKIIKMNFSEEKYSVSLANTKGLSQETQGSAFSFSVEVLAEEKGRSEVGWDYRACRFQKDLDVDAIADVVAEYTLQSLGGSPIASGRYSVMIHPRVATQLLDLVTEALSAEAVQLGRSFWKGKENEKVASDIVQISDDPLLRDGLSSAPFDDEGVPHENLDVVSDGVLKNYFYDLRTARKAGRESNGRGIKEGLSALPKPGPTNFFIRPGDKTLSSILESRGTIFYLHDVMGLHMADPITGEFSLGASGALYKNGTFAKSVRGVTVAGTIGDLFKSVAAVANDLTWYGSVASPHLLVDFLTVAGT